MMHDLPGTKPCHWSQNKLFTDMWVTIASRMMASNNLQMIEVRLIGRYLHGFAFEPFLCIAVMLTCFQSSGRLPSSGDLRSRMSNGGVSASATSLSTHGCHPAGPGDLLGFSFINLFLMISSVRVISSRGVSLGVDCRMGVSS